MNVPYFTVPLLLWLLARECARVALARVGK